VFVDNIRCWVQIGIAGVEDDGYRISGTNVLLVNSAGANTSVIEEPSFYWDNALFCRVEVRFNGNLAYEKDYDIDPSEGFSEFGGGGGGNPPGGAEYEQQFQPGDVRFASNYFAHASTVVIEVKCFFALILDGIWEETTWVTATISPSVYNRVALWKTMYNSAGGGWGADAGKIVDVMNDGIDAFENDAKYGRASAIDDNKSTALADVDISTAIFTVTHGSGSGIAHGQGWDMGDADHYLSWNEIGTVVTDAGDGEVNSYAWVMLYACSTFGSANTIKTKFSVRTTDGVYLGFAAPLDPDAKRADGSICSLALHSQELFAQLASGLDIGRALAETQLEFIPQQSDSGPDCYMQLSGDSMTTLQWVYLTSGERNSLSGNDYKYNDWKWIIEKEV
jgi:hypothetical protein